MEKQDLEKLVQLRADLIKRFERFRDYKNNKNAIMKEIDCVKIVGDTIVAIDSVLKNHVKFE